jgi:NADPH:quinone reductase-like Zn-dependent oxidoreductase
VVHDVDVVLDTLGGEVQRRSWMVLKPGGVLVSVATPHMQEMTGRHVAPGSLTFNQPNTAQLTELAHLTDGGRLRPLVETILPLADARRAHLLSQGGHTRGKIVLLVP